MGRVRNLDKFCQHFSRSFPIARTAQTTLLDIVNVDLSIPGLPVFLSKFIDDHSYIPLSLENYNNQIINENHI